MDVGATVPPQLVPDLEIAERPASPRNFSYGRGGATPIGLVVHTTEGGGAPEWFADPRSHVSAHLVIHQDLRVVRCVADRDTAWACDNSRVNHQTISIECEGFAEHQQMWTVGMTWTLAKLLARLCRDYGIPVQRGLPGIIGHCDVPSEDGTHLGGNGRHSDPGQFFPWDDVLADVAAILSASTKTVSIPVA